MLDVLIHPNDSAMRVDFAMIGLHGRNANKHAFFPFVRLMGFLHTRWILPTAPFEDPLLKGAHAWYQRDGDRDAEISAARREIEALIEDQMRDGVAPENIFLVGFSQGAAMSLHTALRYPRRLGGVVALSGMVIDSERLAQERHPSNLTLPVFMGHGLRDDIIPIDDARSDAAALLEMDVNLDYHEYDTAHRIPSAEVRDIRAFLHRHMYGVFPDDPRSHADGLSPF